MASNPHSPFAASLISSRARGSRILSLIAALMCCGAPGAMAPAQAAPVAGDTLYVFGTSATLPESAEPGIITLPVAGAADANLAYGLLEWTGSTFIYSDWIYFNSTGTAISMASDLYPLGPPPGTTMVGAGYEPKDGSPYDVGFWGFDIGPGFILAQSSEDPAAAVPLPASLSLFAAGLGGLGLLGWGAKRQAKAVAA
jgi:hypothetical protein